MTEQKQNLYEGMYIISAKIGDDNRRKALEKIKSGITERGGTIVKLHDQGRRRLAYDIAGNKEGYYYLIYFNVNPAAISEMWHEYRLQGDLIRFITFTTEQVMDKVEFKQLEVAQ